MLLLPLLVGSMFAAPAIAGEPVPDEDTRLPLALDVRLGVLKQVSGDLPQRPYLGGDLSFRLPGRVWLRGAMWTRQQRWSDLDQDFASFADEFGYDSPETLQWRESFTTVEAAWESPQFGPQLWLRVGASGHHYSDRDFAAVLLEWSSDSVALWSEAAVRAGPVLVLGGDYFIGPVRLEPQLVFSHRRPVWVDSGISNDELTYLENESEVSLPVGFVGPQTSLEGRIGSVYRNISTEIVIVQSWAGLSAYEAWLVDNDEFETEPWNGRVVEFRVGARFGGRNSTAAPAPQADDRPPAGIERTGFAELDELFSKVEELRAEREKLHSALIDARRSLEAIAVRLEVGTAQDLLSGLASGSLDLGLQLQLEGGRPKLVPSGNLTGDSQGVVHAFDGLVGAIVEVQERMPKLLERSKALVEQASKLAQRAPELVKESGISPMKVPAALSAVKDNVQITARLPQELGETLREATGLLLLLTGSGDSK